MVRGVNSELYENEQKNVLRMTISNIRNENNIHVILMPRYTELQRMQMILISVTSSF